MRKPNFREILTRKTLIWLAISVMVSMILGMVGDLLFGPDERASEVRAEAYLAIAQFAPWNIGERYLKIVFTQGDAHAEEFARRQEEQREAFRRAFGCSLKGDPCMPVVHPQGIQAFYLSAYVFPWLRPITAFFDLLLHMLLDQGVIGFLVAGVQIGLGVLLTLIFIKRTNAEMNASYLIGIPVGILVFGSLAALPLWLLAFAGITVLKGFPAGAIGAQAGGTCACFWVCGKTFEVVGHEAMMKQVERVLPD